MTKLTDTQLCESIKTIKITVEADDVKAAID